MLRLSKLTDYAIVVTTAMAAEPQRIYSASDLAADTHLEPPTVAKVLKALVQGGVLRSFRGASGGYQLIMTPARLSVATIIEAMEGPIGMTECAVHEGLCSTEGVCSLRGNWQRISRAVENALRDVTLQDMTQPWLPPIDLQRLRVHGADGDPQLTSRTP